MLAWTPNSLASETDKSTDKTLCADSYRGAQVHRKNGALKRAREALLICVSDRCPSVIQPDCTRWLTEVEAALPSVSFAARGVDGKDITSVRVSVDGQLVAETLDGKAIPVDPGTHAVRFEYAGENPIEQMIVVREGEKARVIDVSWAKTAAHPDPGDEPAGEEKGRKSPVSAWIFGGIGVGAVGTFAALALHGMKRRSDLESSCFGSCRQEDVDSIKTQLTLADVALGVGVVSLGVSAALFLSGGSSKAEPTSARRSVPRTPTVALDVAPLQNGGAATLRGRF